MAKCNQLTSLPSLPFKRVESTDHQFYMACACKLKTSWFMHRLQYDADEDSDSIHIICGCECGVKASLTARCTSNALSARNEVACATLWLAAESVVQFFLIFCVFQHHAQPSIRHVLEHYSHQRQTSIFLQSMKTQIKSRESQILADVLLVTTSCQDKKLSHRRDSARCEARDANVGA